MKFSKIIILLITCLISTTGFCQLTLDYSNFISVGDSIIEHYDNKPDVSITPGKEGANVTWDFQSLKSRFTDTLSIVPSSKTLFSENFNPSDIAICMASTDSSFIYLSHSDNQLKLTGTAYFFLKKRLLLQKNEQLLNIH